MKNKKGWLRIVEAFIAIMIIAGALIFVVERGSSGKEELQTKIYDAQIAILREIELSEELRNDVIRVSASDEEVKWDGRDGSRSGGFPETISSKIQERVPDYLVCGAKICDLDKICNWISPPKDKDTYAQPVAISATSTTYNPKQLKLFCWIR